MEIWKHLITVKNHRYDISNYGEVRKINLKTGKVYMKKKVYKYYVVISNKSFALRKYLKLLFEPSEIKIDIGKSYNIKTINNEQNFPIIKKRKKHVHKTKYQWLLYNYPEFKTEIEKLSITQTETN